MEVFTSPMACSLASHITVLEAGLPAGITYVDTKAKRPQTAGHRAIAPNGYVPTNGAGRRTRPQREPVGPAIFWPTASRNRGSPSPGAHARARLN